MKKQSETIDVLEILAEQHLEVDRLIEQLERGKGDRTEAFQELADKVAAHATVEEKLFYPTVMAKQTEKLLHEAVEEHLVVKRVLADMLELDLEDDEDADEFEAKLAVLKEALSHHAHDQEERKLFPLVRKALDEDERAALGNEVLAMFEALMESEPRKTVPMQVDEPAALPAI